jgi:hypothetical protein
LNWPVCGCRRTATEEVKGKDRNAVSIMFAIALDEWIHASLDLCVTLIASISSAPAEWLKSNSRLTALF